MLSSTKCVAHMRTSIGTAEHASDHDRAESVWVILAPRRLVPSKTYHACRVREAR